MIKSMSDFVSASSWGWIRDCGGGGGGGGVGSDPWDVSGGTNVHVVTVGGAEHVFT